MKRILFLSISICFALSSFGQQWAEMMYDPSSNFYDVQAAFNDYWKDKDITQKGKGYKPFKRWEEFVERRVYPSGDLSQLKLTAINYQKFLEDNGYSTEINPPQSAKFDVNNMINSTTWTPIGPFGPLTGTAGGQLLKSGRINFISVSPTNSNVLFIGAPAGGLWKSTDGGASWATVTDNFPVCGFGDLAFDPTNTNILYAATGDGDAGDTRSVGIYKSTDGGSTWAITGLSFNVSANVRIRRLIVNPSNTQIIMSVGSNGIYRTTNGGTNWTQVSTTNSYDIEFKPGDPNTVYATGTTFRKSTDGGVTWSTISSGIPTTGSNRMAIAVTPNDPNYVYVLASKSSDSGFLGFYRSTDSGTNFTSLTTTLNLLGWASAGNDSGGQGWYDLCIACNPLDKNEVVVGGVNVWRTTNGGTSWSLYGHWTGSGAPFTHADQHDLEYASNGTLFNANDGTVYRRGAASWQEISGTINISEIYKIGLSATTANLWITGHQDNGTSTWNGTTYQARMGGDGMDCFIDRTNNNNMFAEYYNGNFQKSTNGGASWSSCTTGMSGTAPWVTIWKQDPVVAQRLYAGRQNMFVSNNQAGSWTQIGTLPVTGSIREFAIAPSNNQVLYVIKTNAIMKTTNGGSSWSNITGTLSTSIGFENVAICPTDPNKVWVVAGNYSAGNKVFYSSNGGTSWTNWSANLPNIPGNCLLYEPGSNDRIYVGMDVGVYYRDASSGTWTLYNAGLPNIPIVDMENSQAMIGKIVAASYGRGVWMVDFAPSALPPNSSFAVTGTVCAGTTKTFNDNSTNMPTSWSWSVTPSTGVTINTPTSQNPGFTFANSGTYIVAMTASNTNGPGNTYTQSIVVNPSPIVSIAASANTICVGSSVTFTASGASTYSWACPSSSVCTYYPGATTTYTFMGTSSQGCTGVGSKVIVVDPYVSVNASASNTLICSAQSVTLSATGASTYTWNPGNLTGSSIVVNPTVNTTYVVSGTSGVCTNSSSIVVQVGTTPTVTAVPSETLICAGTVATITASGATTYSWNTGATTSSITVTPVLTTTYTVTGYNGSCSSTYTITLNVSWCAGIKEEVIVNTFKVFPNPFNDNLNYSAAEEVDVKLYNALGQLIIEEQRNFKGEINTSQLPKGVYMIEIKGKSGTKSLKVVKD